MGHEFDGDMHKEFTDSDQNSIHFIGTKIYSVQTCCIYYTSYNLQQECDTVNPQTLCCNLPLLRKMLNLTGMQGFLVSIMPIFGPGIQQFMVAEMPGIWISFGFVGLVKNQTIARDFAKHAC